jgi:hypothetical protein
LAQLRLQKMLQQLKDPLSKTIPSWQALEANEPALPAAAYEYEPATDVLKGLSATGMSEDMSPPQPFGKGIRPQGLTEGMPGTSERNPAQLVPDAAFGQGLVAFGEGLEGVLKTGELRAGLPARIRAAKLREHLKAALARQQDPHASERV